VVVATNINPKLVSGISGPPFLKHVIQVSYNMLIDCFKYYFRADAISATNFYFGMSTMLGKVFLSENFS